MTPPSRRRNSRTSAIQRWHQPLVILALKRMMIGVHYPLVIFAPAGCAGTSHPSGCNSRKHLTPLNSRSRTNADGPWAPAACHPCSQTNADNLNAVAICDRCSPPGQGGLLVAETHSVRRVPTAWGPNCSNLQSRANAKRRWALAAYHPRSQSYTNSAAATCDSCSSREWGGILFAVMQAARTSANQPLVFLTQEPMQTFCVR